MCGKVWMDPGFAKFWSAGRWKVGSMDLLGPEMTFVGYLTCRIQDFQNLDQLVRKNPGFVLCNLGSAGADERWIHIVQNLNQLVYTNLGSAFYSFSTRESAINEIENNRDRVSESSFPVMGGGGGRAEKEQEESDVLLVSRWKYPSIFGCVAVPL